MKNRIQNGLIVLETVDSTNDYLKRNFDRLDDLSAVLAFEQTKGKGRLGRRWESTEGTLNLSVLLKRETVFPFLSLLCPLAVSDALERAAALKTGIKWPNDILVNGKKLCGILIENVLDGDAAACRTIIGIGINVNNTGFPDSLKDKATSVFLETGRRLDIVETGGVVADELMKRLGGLKGGASVIDEYTGRCVTIGRMISASVGDVDIAGVALSVNGDGSLVIEAADGKKASIYSGEVIQQL